MSEDAKLERRFPCEQCGAILHYAPASEQLKCAYCGHENPIERIDEPIEELDYREHLAQLEAAATHDDIQVVRCEACTAETTFEPNVTSSRCAFCGSDIVVTRASKRLLKPRSLLPFRVTQVEGLDAYRAWLRKLWFAPTKLVSKARAGDRLQGIYVPYWTFDADTHSHYRGERGDDSWDTVTRTVLENGKHVQKEDRVRKTRWRSVFGTVHAAFDDLLVLASETLPAKVTARLEPWDLAALVPYEDSYLAGFRAESYAVALPEGFERAKHVMQTHIRRLVERDIGGDHQRIHEIQTRYRDVTFKYVLLPIWISSYRYHGKTYRFLINGRTGEVQGERPYSSWKIAVLVLLIGAIVAALFALLAN